VGTPDRIRRLGRPKRKWGNNIKANFKEIGRDCVDFIYLSYDSENWLAVPDK
jgi:hypothetical protein